MHKLSCRTVPVLTKTNKISYHKFSLLIQWSAELKKVVITFPDQTLSLILVSHFQNNIGSDQIEVAVLPKKGRARIIGLSSSLTIIQRNSCFRKSPVQPPILISIYKINTTNTILNVASMENETQSVQVNYILTVGHIIINGIACPFTVLLNVLVILVVKRRPSLQSNTNILLSCLAVTDLLTGLIAQPSFVVWKTLYVLKNINFTAVKEVHNYFLRTFIISSSLHLMLVTCERLLAIRYTNHYLYIATRRNIKVSVVLSWFFSFIISRLRYIKYDISRYVMKTLHFLAISFSVVFIVVAYIILYLETLRHRKKIRTQQLPQQEIERFVKENKALKTTVLVVGAVVLCFLPMAVYQLLTTLSSRGNKKLLYDTELVERLTLMVRTAGMLNSLVNPLIYCMRQKELRKFVSKLL